MNRLIQAEGAFGVLKYDYGFKRFLTCGKTNVKIELLLLSMEYNINKLRSKMNCLLSSRHIKHLKMWAWYTFTKTCYCHRKTPFAILNLNQIQLHKKIRQEGDRPQKETGKNRDAYYRGTKGRHVRK